MLVRVFRRVPSDALGVEQMHSKLLPTGLLLLAFASIFMIISAYEDYLAMRIDSLKLKLCSATMYWLYISTLLVVARLSKRNLYSVARCRPLDTRYVLMCTLFVLGTITTATGFSYTITGAVMGIRGDTVLGIVLSVIGLPLLIHGIKKSWLEYCKA